MNIVWSAIIIYSVSERIIFLLISWEMLLLFVPIYTCHLHNVWQFLAIFFFIVSLHNLGSLKSICQGFFCISISCLFTWWFVWCLFFRDFHHLLFQGFFGITDLSSVTIDRCWVGWGGELKWERGSSLARGRALPAS